MKAKALGSIALATLMLLAMCIVAGRPQVFSDTKSYYALGQEMALAFGPPHSAASTEALRGHALPAAQAKATTRLAYTVSASRSPYWSVLLYLAASLGTAWLVVVAQALVAAVVLWIAARGLGVARAYLPIVAVLACLSSLPVEVMFVMPDLFAGLTILAALVLLVGRIRLKQGEVVALWLVMAAGALFHTSHLLILAALGLGTLAVALASRRRWPALLPAGALAAGTAMLTAAVVALVGAIAFPVAVRAMRGEPIYAPPFLAARLIADGPGRQVLRTDCATGAPWGWCPYARLPLNDVNTILWDTHPRAASFQAADYDRRVRIIDEQPRFVLAVVGRYPGAVARTVLTNVGHLFLRYGTSETLGDPTSRYRDPHFAIFTRLVPETADCAAGRASCAPRLDIALLDAIIGWTLLASIVVIASLLATGRARREEWRTAATFLLAGLIVNAVVCGGISGNAERYQSRITWLIPLLAAVMLAGRMGHRSAATTVDKLNYPKRTLIG
jgi:hypothetical protein